MAVDKRDLGKTLAVGLMLGGGGVALWVGYLVANSGNSDDLLGLREALVGGAVAAGILAVMAAALIAVARRFGLSMRGDLARLVAWVLFIPASAWTALCTLFLLMMSGGHEPMTIEDVAPGWAVLAMPLFAASALLFLIAHRR